MYPANSLTDPSLAVPFEFKGLNPDDRRVNINAKSGSLMADTINVRQTFIVPQNNVSTPVYSAGAIAYSSENQQLQVSDGTKWNNILAGATNATLVFRPGYTGPQSNGVYGTWASLYADLIKIDGEKYILFDNALIPNATAIEIPAGAWDMSNTTWYTPTCFLMPPPTLFTPLHILDGASVNGLCGINGLLDITYFGTTGPAITVNVTPASKGVVLYVTNGARIGVAGGQPFIDVVTGFYEIVFHFGTVLQTTDVIRSSAGALTLVGLGTYATVGNNTLTGPGDVTVLRFAPGNIIQIPLDQSVSGTLSVTNFYTTPDTYSYSGAPTAGDDSGLGYKVGDMWIDTTLDTLYIAVNVSLGSAVWRGPI